MQSGILTVEETARLLKVSEKTVYRLVKGGELRCIWVRRSIRIPASNVEEYVAAGGSRYDER